MMKQEEAYSDFQHLNGDIPNTSPKSSKTGALRLVDLFLQSDTASVFPNIPKEVFVKDLKAHLTNPTSIQQGGNGTCGAAALLKYMVEEHPLLYVRTAIALYSRGFFSNNGVMLGLPNEAFSGNMKDLRRLGINTVDAIMQGALTNSQNLFLRYNPFQDGSGARSFMWPGRFVYLVRRFVGAKCSFRFLPTTRYIESMDHTHHYVVGVVHTKFASPIYSGFPNHYIQILKAEKGILDYWSWGWNYAGASVKLPFWNGFFMVISISID